MEQLGPVDWDAFPTALVIIAAPRTWARSCALHWQP